MEEYYVKLDEVISNMETGGLLIGNNLEWAKEAVFKASKVDLQNFVDFNTMWTLKMQMRQQDIDTAKLFDKYMNMYCDNRDVHTILRKMKDEFMESIGAGGN